MESVIKHLDRFKAKGILSEIDIQFCKFLNDLGREVEDEVLIAACLASYLHRRGHVCFSLREHAGSYAFGHLDETINEERLQIPDFDTWRSVLKNSSFVGKPGDITPLILEGERLYLQKSWYHENQLAQKLLNKSREIADIFDTELLNESLNRLFPKSGENGPDWQKVASLMAVTAQLAVISGGPGTGKTTTVIKILALLIEQGIQKGRIPKIGLAAPTGKAAARLNDSLVSGKKRLPCSEEVKELIPENSSTLHQMLGARYHSSRFRYNSDHPLPFDIVIIDEVSMVDQTLMSHLLDALLDHTRLILLGDKDQLASVEAGSVLGDICSRAENRFSSEFVENISDYGIEISSECVNDDPFPLTDSITLLKKNYRFKPDSGITLLADFVNRGAGDKATDILQSDSYPDVNLLTTDGEGFMGKAMKNKIATHYLPLQQLTSPKEVLKAISTFTFLSVHRRGKLGSDELNTQIENILKTQLDISRHREWYAGRPVMITRNDYMLGLFNGDIGVVWPDAGGTLQVYFEREGNLKMIKPERLNHYDPAYCLTVHKSQGSEFDRVVLLLPLSESRVLSREVIYTAITRTRESIEVWGKEKRFKEGVSRQMTRTSGLKDKLWPELPDTDNGEPDKGQLSIFE